MLSQLKRKECDSVAAVAFDESNYSLIFIDEYVQVNSAVYIKMLENDMFLCVKDTVVDQYFFIEDGAPVHP